MTEYPNIKNVLQDKLLKGEIKPMKSTEKSASIMFKLDKTTFFSLNERDMNLYKGDFILVKEDGTFGYLLGETVNKDYLDKILKETNYIDAYILAAEILFKEKYLEEREAFIKDLILANKTFEKREVENIVSAEDRDTFEEALIIAIKEKLAMKEEKEKEERDLIEKKIEKRDMEVKKETVQKQKEIDYYLNMMTDILNSADYSEREKIDDAGDRIEDASANYDKSHTVTKEAAITREYDKVEESEDIKEGKEIKEEEIKVEEPKNGTRTILDDILEIDDDDDDRYEDIQRELYFKL